jgi:hypothetical protein
MVFVPFLGIPFIAKKILILIPGLFLMFLGIVMSQESHHKNHTGLSYEEKKPEKQKIFEPLQAISEENSKNEHTKNIEKQEVYSQEYEEESNKEERS